MLIPKALKKSDTIGIVSPSGAISKQTKRQLDSGIKFLQKLGFKTVIGKNALKKASKRNLLRRRIKAILSSRAVGPGKDVVVIVGDGQEGVNFSGLENKILNLFNKIKK